MIWTGLFVLRGEPVDWGFFILEKKLLQGHLEVVPSATREVIKEMQQSFSQ